MTKPTIDDLKKAVQKRGKVREIPIQAGSPYNIEVVGWKLQVRVGKNWHYAEGQYKFAAYAAMAEELGIDLSNQESEDERQ